MERDMKGSSHDITEIESQNFQGVIEKTSEASLSITGFPPKILTEHLSNSSLE
jgi:hypothetical protein